MTLGMFGIYVFLGLLGLLLAIILVASDSDEFHDGD